MADKENVGKVAEPKTGLKLMCLIERKFGLDSKTGSAFKYLSVTCLYQDEVFKFSIRDEEKRHFEYLMAKDGYVITDSNDLPVTAEDLAKIPDYQASLKTKLSGL